MALSIKKRAINDDRMTEASKCCCTIRNIQCAAICIPRAAERLYRSRSGRKYHSNGHKGNTNFAAIRKVPAYRTDHSKNGLASELRRNPKINPSTDRTGISKDQCASAFAK